MGTQSPLSLRSADSTTSPPSLRVSQNSRAFILRPGSAAAVVAVLHATTAEAPAPAAAVVATAAATTTRAARLTRSAFSKPSTRGRCDIVPPSRIWLTAPGCNAVSDFFFVFRRSGVVRRGWVTLFPCEGFGGGGVCGCVGGGGLEHGHARVVFVSGCGAEEGWVGPFWVHFRMPYNSIDQADFDCWGRGGGEILISCMVVVI